MLNKGIVALLISSLFVNYALGAVASDCTTAGQYLDNTATCSTCPANKYCPGYPTSQTAAAINCPAGTQTASGTTTGQDALSDCSPCAAGSYSAPGIACTTAQCPTHNYCPATGSRDGGTTANTATVITKCPAGTQTGGAALSNCAACNAGEYSAQGTGCSTAQCLADNYCPVTGSRDGGTTPNTATILVPCGAGKTSSAGSKVEADCKVSSSGFKLLTSSSVLMTAALGYLTI